MATLSGRALTQSALRPGFHLARGMRVGLLGGSFNPAHAGHAHVAQTAMRRLRLDRVIWLVSPQNPLKDPRDSAPLSDRIDSARRQARGAGMIVSDFESRLGLRYTVDTLSALQTRYPGVHFVWLMGLDSLAAFHRWRFWTEVMRRVPVAVVARPGPIAALLAPVTRRFAAHRVPGARAGGLALMTPPVWAYLNTRHNRLSSTEIRRRHKSA